ncbi:Acyl dehydratase [Tistlia consotensis]|uniref:Acyl dehydratase n=1 Tax=Tistlia consotensis USBA 355 TaxID=560819 RepID=A0A1Y6C290_9PROT|nr:MaoC family dehydratase [Tistlia consotensis]SMF41496.1 Acyl dehydratase [Tistlia consotensis USBA 355]SNR73692.1 Acyl dehydratase [Tistlia consotensis]
MPAGGLDLDSLPSKVGCELGTSDWHLVDQDRVSAFAAVTEDFQFIHVDPERAAATRFGGTIAHGFLPLSLLSVLFLEACGEVRGAGLSMNYGFDSVRFIAPLRTGRRIRGRFGLKDCLERQPGQWRLVLESAVEIEGEDKPALVADWIVLLLGER